LCKNYAAELQSPKDPKDPLDIFTFNEVYFVFKTDSELKMLYLSNEGAGEAPVLSGLYVTGKEDTIFTA